MTTFADGADDHAIAEGRGYRDADEWRYAHRAFFQSQVIRDFLGRIPEISDSTLVVLERFRVVNDKPSGGR